MTDPLETWWLDAMRRGAFDDAHAISDVVLARRDPADSDDKRLPYHLRWVWDGRDLAGRHVLVRCYHGLGDTIQFARYLPVLRRHAASVTVEVQPALWRLLRTMAGPDRVIPFRPEQPARPAECNVEIMELAYALRLDAFGAAVPYFSVAPRAVACRTKLQVGLCWRAGEWDSARSVPEEALWTACDVPRTAARSLALPPRTDVMATAAMIAALDLVVTVDTMVAHLAGALGRETWLLLRRDCDWRWVASGTVSPWYPSVHLYRQEREGDWSAPLARLSADLRLRAAAAGC